MSISGSLEDVSVADVMQFIHLGRRTGTLVLSRDGEKARIGFHFGKLVSASAPGRLKLGDRLVSSGLLNREILERAISIQGQEKQRRSLGQILIGEGAVDPEELRRVIVQQIEGTVSEVVTWSHGTFEFVVDDLQPVDDIALYPSDIVPDADINTQMVLLEAARIFDERNRDEPEDDTQPLRREEADSFESVAADAAVPAEPPRERLSRAAALNWLEQDAIDRALDPDAARELKGDFSGLWLDIVSGDESFARHLAQALPEDVPYVGRVELADVAVSVPGELVPVAVVDLRRHQVQIEGLQSLHRSHPRLAIIALVEPGISFVRVYEAGALAALPAEVGAVLACLENILEARQGGPFRPARGLRGSQAGVARLRRVFGDLRSGLISATVALNLMHIISESVERAVLFLVKRNALTALGAFGTGTGGRPLAELTRGLKIPLEEDNALTRSLDEGEARSLSYGEAGLPEHFARLLGPPANGQVVVFPVLGAQRVIAIIYTDNGERDEAIEDIEILELATAQVGMAFENELLRRQISQKG